MLVTASIINALFSFNSPLNHFLPTQKAQIDLGFNLLPLTSSNSLVSPFAFLLEEEVLQKVSLETHQKVLAAVAGGDESVGPQLNKSFPL